MSTSQDAASYSKHLVDLLKPEGWAELIALPGSERAKGIEEGRDRYWESMIARLDIRQSGAARIELQEATARFKSELALAGLAELGYSPSGRKRGVLCRSAKKSKSAKLALQARAAHDSVDREIEKGRWEGALKSAIRFGYCIGRLAGKNENGKGRRTLPQKKILQARVRLVDRSFLSFMRDPKTGSRKFDIQAAVNHDKTRKLSGIRAAHTLSNLLTGWRNSLRPFGNDKTPENRQRLATGLLHWRKLQKRGVKSLLLAS